MNIRVVLFRTLADYARAEGIESLKEEIIRWLNAYTGESWVISQHQN